MYLSYSFFSNNCTAMIGYYTVYFFVAAIKLWKTNLAQLKTAYANCVDEIWLENRILMINWINIVYFYIYIFNQELFYSYKEIWFFSYLNKVDCYQNKSIDSVIVSITV